MHNGLPYYLPEFERDICIPLAFAMNDGLINGRVTRIPDEEEAGGRRVEETENGEEDGARKWRGRTKKHENSSLSSPLSSEESDEVILFCGEQMKPYPSPGTIILTPPPPPPADPAPAFTDEATPHFCLLPTEENSSAQNALAGSVPQICTEPREEPSRRARVQAGLDAYRESEPLSWAAPHYQTWRDAQTTKETNAQRRARYLLLYPHTGSADPRVMYHAIVDVLRKAGPGASVKLQDIRRILGLRDVTLCSILESHTDVFDCRGGH